MIISFSYSNFPDSDKSFYPGDFSLPDFVDLASVFYVLRYFLCNKVTLLKFPYKIIGIIYTASNSNMKIILPRFLRKIFDLTLPNCFSTYQL